MGNITALSESLWRHHHQRNQTISLGIIDCPKLIGELPRQLSSLQRLEIGGCHKLVLPNGQLGIFQGDVKQFSSLSVLKISWMENLKELCRELNKLASPEYLEIYNCGFILPFPMSYLPASLKTLVCDTCRNLELESETWQSGSLESLGLNGCRSLKALSLGSFHILTEISPSNCTKLEQMEALLPSLRYLSIYDCPEIEYFSEEGLPSGIQSLVKLCSKKNLKMLSCSGLGNLTSLENLKISFCIRLLSLPED
ncbi:unnamed protein product [Coffea canephora]|uniref:DH200=94 genomic scaffold, scaffold_230 n=1 Tax=Coffea canephora TaxID=49390 RepID=A0A068VF85_COFCA|nr:unnamed protein product [Coffea canephora]